MIAFRGVSREVKKHVLRIWRDLDEAASVDRVTGLACAASHVALAYKLAGAMTYSQMDRVREETIQKAHQRYVALGFDPHS